MRSMLLTVDDNETGDSIKETEVLLQFLNLVPIGLIRFTQDGAIQLMNACARQLLMPFVPQSGFENMSQVLAAMRLDMVETTKCFQGPSKSVYKVINLQAEGGEVVYSLSVERVTSKIFMAVLQDVSHAIAQDRQMDALARLVGTDPLTRVLNRRAGEDELSVLFRAWKRDRRISTFVMADIDNFKQINDTMGHEAGDEALVLLADFLKPRLRPLDVLIRWGGDEFLFLLPETRAQDALQFVERLRNEIALTPFMVKGKQRLLSMSFGVAQLDVPANDPHDVVKRADSALYAAKSHGRNVVMLERSRVLKK